MCQWAPFSWLGRCQIHQVDCTQGLFSVGSFGVDITRYSHTGIMFLVIILRFKVPHGHIARHCLGQSNAWLGIDKTSSSWFKGRPNLTPAHSSFCCWAADKGVYSYYCTHPHTQTNLFGCDSVVYVRWGVLGFPRTGNRFSSYKRVTWSSMKKSVHITVYWELYCG